MAVSGWNKRTLFRTHFQPETCHLCQAHPGLFRRNHVAGFALIVVAAFLIFLE
jgi:hypothetical protein